MVAGIAGQLVLPNNSLVALVVLLGLGIALHVLALVIVGYLEEEG